MSDLDPAGLPDAAIGSEHQGVRVWFVPGGSHQELVDRLAVILGERMADGDELHISYHAMQNGSQLRERVHMFKPDEQWTELSIEDSGPWCSAARARTETRMPGLAPGIRGAGSA